MVKQLKKKLTRRNKALYHAFNFVNVNLKHILEFGVFRGKSVSLIRKTFDNSFKVFGFDSFLGWPCDMPRAITKNGHIGKKKGLFNRNGQIPNIEGVTFFKGWFKDTIPDYLSNGQDIGLLHIDCDLYSSTLTTLFGLNKYIVKDTIIVFGCWFYNHKRNSSFDDEEQKAFYEWVEKFDKKYEFIKFPVSTSSEQQIVRIF